jgi:hypothetical protein
MTMTAAIKIENKTVSKPGIVYAFTKGLPP